MQTIIYIDGFNLYYGCLKNTDDKWLDLFALFSYILNEQNPNSELIKIKFFTANIKTKFATNKRAQQSQLAYHRALKHTYGDNIEIISSYFSLEKAILPKYQKQIDKDDTVAVWKLEEKKSDVNLVLNAYRDAMNDIAKQFVFVTNDSDIEPVITYIKSDFPCCKIGIITPVRKNSKRPKNDDLSKNADWTKKYLDNYSLSRYQLKNQVATKKKPIIKPDYW